MRALRVEGLGFRQKMPNAGFQSVRSEVFPRVLMPVVTSRGTESNMLSLARPCPLLITFSCREVYGDMVMVGYIASELLMQPLNPIPCCCRFHMQGGLW